MKRPVLDPTTMKDWQIAEAAEPFMKPMMQLATEMGLRGSEIIPMVRSASRAGARHSISRGRLQGAASPSAFPWHRSPSV